ncbi:hypothetical protein [Novipirellula rosea]|uniref:Uncharacterized protein n=1 Tax=Novipirellula rosea TaxID=1031540 RepID=A0ABP8MVV2_9BACT
MIVQTTASVSLSDLRTVGLACLRQHTFYWLRHKLETISGNTGDQDAVNAVMGRVDASMSAVYRHEIDGHRVVKVCNQVRSWLNDN